MSDGPMISTPEEAIERIHTALPERLRACVRWRRLGPNSRYPQRIAITTFNRTESPTPGVEWGIWRQVFAVDLPAADDFLTDEMIALICLTAR